MDEVARLQAVAEDDGPFAREEPCGETWDGGGVLALRVLTRPVDVEEPQRDALQAIRARVRRRIELAGDLLGRIRARRTRWEQFMLRLLGSVAVRRARAGQHNAP